MSRPQDSYEVPLGCFLGDMTDELKGYGSGAYISEFIGAGPKNYAYRVTSNGTDIAGECLKVRGINLNFKARQTINFDLIRDMVHAYVAAEKDPITKKIHERRIVRNKDHEIFTKMVGKDYRIVFNKLALFPDFSTLPFGYGTPGLDSSRRWTTPDF